jgi:putative nucleotidyltransferase with HDIG domain
MSDEKENKKKVAIPLREFRVEQELPGTVFLYLNFRYVLFRSAGDTIDRPTYDRLEFRKVRSLYIHSVDAEKFGVWSKEEYGEVEVLNESEKEIGKVREVARLPLLNIFVEKNSDAKIQEVILAAKSMAAEYLKPGFVARNLRVLQSVSKGTVDHSLNVGMLAGFLGMNMGYTHQGILQNLITGGYLHDIGKAMVQIDEEDTPEEYAEKMRGHSSLGVKMLDVQADIPEEVKMIVGQHHEYSDGSGYPDGLKKFDIYDLAKLIAIVNIFDETVRAAKGSMKERQIAAIHVLDKNFIGRLDQQKLLRS